MNTTGSSSTEDMVQQLLKSAQKKITVLEQQSRNLPADKGPELKPMGGPTPPSRARQQVELQKAITQVKEEMLQSVDKHLEKAPADVKERCNLAVDAWLYPEPMSRKQEKDLGASQAFLVREAHEKKQQEQPPKELKKEDRKTMEESERFMFSQRYGKEMPSPDKDPEPTKSGDQKLKKEDRKDLDASQDFAFSLRYANKVESGAITGPSKFKEEIDLDKE